MKKTTVLLGLLLTISAFGTSAFADDSCDMHKASDLIDAEQQKALNYFNVDPAHPATLVENWNMKMTGNPDGELCYLKSIMIMRKDIEPALFQIWVNEQTCAVTVKGVQL